MSALTIWQSDALCRLSTGGGFAAGSSSTDHRERIIEAERPIIVNGIDEFIRRGDLIDRSIFLELPPLADGTHRGPRELWAEFDRERALLLGSLLDAVAGGIRLWPEVNLESLSRMADLDRWGEAVVRGLGWPSGTFVDAYRANRKTASADLLGGASVAQALFSLLTERDRICCTATDLLEALNRVKRRLAIGSANWPESVWGLTAALRRVAPQLRQQGCNISFARTHAGRIITIERS